MRRTTLALAWLAATSAGCGDSPANKTTGSVAASGTTSAQTGSAPVGPPAASAALPAGGTPVTVAQAKKPSELVFDGHTLFWLEPESGEVFSVSAEGGSAERLAAGLALPSSLALDDGYLYVGEARGEGRVVRIPRQGGAVEQLLKSPNGAVRGLAIDATELYFCAEGERALFVAPKGSGLARRLSDGCDRDTHLAVDATHVYWSAHGAQGAGVLRVAKEGGSAAPLFESAARMPELVALEGDEVTFTTRGEVALMAVAKGGGAARTLLVGEASEDWSGLAVGSGHAYVAERGKGPVLRVARKSAGASVAQEIASEAGAAPVSVRVDATFAYWSQAGAIMKVLLPR